MWLKKIWKYLSRFGLGLLFLLVLLAVLIQISPVQSYLTAKLTHFLEEKLETEVQIDAIRLRLLESLVLQGVYVEDQQQDTLLNLDELTINFTLYKLLVKKIEFDRIGLHGGTVHLETLEDGSSNLDFVIDAFSSDKEKPEKTTASPWRIGFDNAPVDVKKVNFSFNDASVALLLEVKVGEIDGLIKEIDLEEQIYRAKKLDVRNTNVRLEISGRDTPEPDTVTVKEVMDAYSGIFTEAYEFHASNVNFDLKLPDLALGTSVGELAFNYGIFSLDQSDMIIRSEYLQFDNSGFYFDVPSAPYIDGYDYNHFSLENISAEIINFDFNNLIFEANVLHVSGREKKGFQLDDLKAKCYFYHDSIRVRDLRLLSAGSNIKSENILLTYPLISETLAPVEQLGLSADMVADKLDLQEARFFYPGMDSLDFYKNNKNTPVQLKAEIDGTLGNLGIPLAEFKSKNTQLRFDGNLQNMMQVDRLGFILNLKQLQTSAKGVKEWLPPGTIPAKIQIPEKILLRGSVAGTTRFFQAFVNGQAKRTNYSEVANLKANATIRNILDTDSTFFNIRLDTLVTSRHDLLAYIPPEALPSYVHLPERVLLTGKAVGTYAAMDTELRLLTFRNRNTTQITAAGKIGKLLQPSETFLDLSFDSEDLDQEELLSYLPDSLLPAYLQWPTIKKLTGMIKGNVHQFESNLKFHSNTGLWQLDASMNDSSDYDVKLKVDDFLVEAFFNENEYEQRIGIPLSPWTVNVTLNGKGLDITKKAKANLRLEIKKAGMAISKGVVIDGVLEDKIFSATARANEPELKMKAQFMINYKNSIPETELSLDLDKLDIQLLKDLAVPFWVSGDLEAKVDGYQLDTLSGALLVDNIQLAFDESFHEINGLLALMKMDNGYNNLNLASDVFNAELGGWFKFPQLSEAMNQQLQSYFQPEYPDSLIGNTRDSFEFAFELLRPEVLTTGVLPGLEELAPFKFTASYDNNIAFMEAHALIPYANWYGMILDTIGFDLTLGNGIGDYIFRMKNIDLLDVVKIPMFEVSGTYIQEWIANQVIIFDEARKERFGLRANFQVEDNETFHFKLEEKQILDYETWRVDPDNIISLSGKNLQVKDWLFYRKNEIIDISQIADNQIRIGFEQFDLDMVAQTLNQSTNYLGGILNGAITITDPLEKPQLFSNFNVDSFQLLKAGLGDLKLLASFDENSHINTSAQLEGRGNDIKIVGKYNIKDPVNAIDSFKINIRHLSLPTLEPMMSDYLSKVEGVLKGNVVVTGNFTQPALMGEINFDSTAFNVELLQTRLRLGTQPILFDANAIEFQDLQVFDPQNNQATISAYLLTEDYREYVLSTQVSAKNFLVLDTDAEDNDLYYGKLIVDAEAQLSGRTSEPIVEIKATPKRGSALTYVYSAENAQIESHQGIVEFVDPEEDERRRRNGEDQIRLVSNDLNMEIKLRATVDQNLDFKVITNPLTGDYFESKAKGDLSFTQYPDGEMELTGGLEVVQGKYLFTYQEVVRRPFDLVPGSTITWTGDPYNPNLDLQVKYEVRASPYPLFANQETAQNNSNLSRRQLFNVLLDIGGTVNKTEIKSSIEYPEAYGNTGDSEIETVIQQINLDESSQNTQAFALILFNGFIAQNIGNSDLQIVDIQGNVNNLITQQLNNLANRYIKFVELDFGLDTYDQGSNGTRSDFRFSVRKRFLNDRLSINIDGVTSAESGQDESNSQTYLDNITIEYSLTPDGRFRIKVYNQRDFDDFIGQTGLKVGGALVFSKDFKKFRLFKKKDKN